MENRHFGYNQKNLQKTSNQDYIALSLNFCLVIFALRGQLVALVIGHLKKIVKVSVIMKKLSQYLMCQSKWVMFMDMCALNHMDNSLIFVTRDQQMPHKSIFPSYFKIITLIN
jgi:hypothetical protein